jgi:hypothetical protein
MVLRTALGAMNRHLNNNTPVNTEVLWGGGVVGLWVVVEGVRYEHTLIDCLEIQFGV